MATSRTARPPAVDLTVPLPPAPFSLAAVAPAADEDLFFFPRREGNDAVADGGRRWRSNMRGTSLVLLSTAAPRSAYSLSRDYVERTKDRDEEIWREKMHMFAP